MVSSSRRLSSESGLSAYKEGSTKMCSKSRVSVNVILANGTKLRFDAIRRLMYFLFSMDKFMAKTNQLMSV